MAMSRKAYFFSLTVLLLLAILTLYLSSRADPGHTRQSAVRTQRLIEGQAFIDSLQDDAATALYVAAYRSFLVLDQEVLYKQDAWVSGFDTRYEELVLHGTLDGAPLALTWNYSIDVWLRNVGNITEQLQLGLRIDNLEVEAWQNSPWYVQVNLTGDLTVADNLTDAVWKVPLYAKTNVSIELLNDPLYTKGTQQRYLQRITKSPANPAVPPALPAADQRGHIKDRHYAATSNGPSFLDRLQGRFAPSVHGIESLVDAEKMENVSIRKSGSIIDWQYFVAEDPTADCQLDGVPDSWAVVPSSRGTEYACTAPAP